jgi:transposase InsO family protein
VREVVEQGSSVEDVARAFGIMPHTIDKWLERYERNGVDGLVPLPAGRPVASPAAADPRRDAVIELRTAHPEYGTRRIRDVLERFSALGVSETEVRRILHEAGLIEAAPARGPREHPPRRFERAEPNQLWQSDIFTFLLRRHERLYVAAFMDDHSRFLVSWAMAHHQRSMLVMEALSRGLATFGVPREVLTDQGRQYTAWRGETEFEQELRRNGIRHIKSRPQHPQTVGKVERFWKTLWDEFLSRTVFADYTDCERRIGLFVHAYNFERPHQALDGLVPADRYFRAAPHVRDALKANVEANAMRRAHEQPPRKPFYLVGRLGDQDLSIAATAGAIRVKVGDRAPETIELPKEESDGTKAPRGWSPAGEQTDTDDAAMADETAGLGRGGAAAVLDGAQRAEWRAERDGGDRVRGHLAADVLRPGEAGARWDVGGAGAGQRSGDVEPARGTGAQGGGARTGETARREATRADSQGGQARHDEGGGGPAAWQPSAPSLDEAWGIAFEQLDDEDPERDERAAFDPDAGWRGRAVSWERKLAGAEAGGSRVGQERDDGQEQEEPVHAGAAGAAGGGADVRSGAERLERADDGGGGSAWIGHGAQSLSDDDAPRSGGTDRGAATAADRTASFADGTGTRAGAREPAASTGQREAGATRRDDRAPAGHRGGVPAGAFGTREDEDDGDASGGDEA